MPDKWPLANGNWSNAANWNGGTKPVAGDDVFADGRTVTVDESFTVATLRTTQRSGGTVGGTFDFNTSGVTGNATSTTPIFISALSVSHFTITASSGTITLNVGGTVSYSGVNISNANIFNHTGNCNFTVNGSSFVGTSIAVGNARIFLKSSTGILTVVGNLQGATGGAGSVQNDIISSSAGSEVVVGNLTGGSAFTTNRCIVKTAGTSLTVTGNVTGGTAASAIDSSAPINNINGNVTAGSVNAVFSSSANIVNVTGTVTASATSQAISMTNANGQVYLNGNMVNNNGKMAIFAPIVWLDKNNTTSAAFFTSGGVARTLYSADTVPNTPAVNNVREGVVFGAGNSLTGTIEMPVAANVRNGVVYDNGTTGTALFTTSQLLTEINASSDAVAVRMKNAATPEILGELMEAFKK